MTKVTGAMKITITATGTTGATMITAMAMVTTSHL
jgi:hypothetical protein